MPVVLMQEDSHFAVIMCLIERTVDQNPLVCTPLVSNPHGVALFFFSRSVIDLVKV